MKATRRRFCLVLALLLLVGNLNAQVHPTTAHRTAVHRTNQYLLFVGTYTEKDSKGIYAFRSGASGGPLESLGLVAETANPSFLAVDPSRHFLYAANEISTYKGQASGALTAFAIDRQSGRLSSLNEVPSRGAGPCYVSLDKTGKFVLVANYDGGNVAVFPVLKDGQLGESSAFVQHQGSGVNPKRQEAPHAHWIETTPDNRFAIAADLGLDQVKVYRFDAGSGSLTPNDPPFAKVSPGSGPRHVAFSPSGKFVYVLNEIKSTVDGFAYDAGRGELHSLQTISTLPKNFSGDNDAAEIHVHPSGKFLLASNRGHDSIAVFSIHKSDGMLTLVDQFSVQGKTPRNFEIDPTGRYVFVANEESGTVVIFQIDPKTGRLTATGQVLHVPSPVCLKFVLTD